jgi:hypothetical protein
MQCKPSTDLVALLFDPRDVLKSEMALMLCSVCFLSAIHCHSTLYTFDLAGFDDEPELLHSVPHHHV